MAYPIVSYRIVTDVASVHFGPIIRRTDKLVQSASFESDNLGNRVGSDVLT